MLHKFVTVWRKFDSSGPLFASFCCLHFLCTQNWGPGPKTWGSGIKSQSHIWDKTSFTECEALKMLRKFNIFLGNLIFFLTMLNTGLLWVLDQTGCVLLPTPPPPEGDLWNLFALFILLVLGENEKVLSYLLPPNQSGGDHTEHWVRATTCTQRA